jgi:hypothetical protein
MGLSDPSSNAEMVTPWQFLALDDQELERTDLVLLNLSVASGIVGMGMN